MKHLFMAACLLCIPVLIAARQRAGNIPPPAGFTRVSAAPGSFTAWLRAVSLKKDNTVYLYDGTPKRNQQAQYAVLDISVGRQDLQQCADAVMRLYAEWRYSQQQYEQINFRATDGTWIGYGDWRRGDRFVLRAQHLQKVRSAGLSTSRADFDQYLQTVFSYAGTLSLSKQLQPVPRVQDMMPGDVFIKGGMPGHAVIVMDVAVNAAGEKCFLLAQSYMPAQDIHILKNPYSNSPWYSTAFGNALVTPEWVFSGHSLTRW